MNPKLPNEFVRKVAQWKNQMKLEVWLQTYFKAKFNGLWDFIFFTPMAPSRVLSLNFFFQKTLILAIEANSVTSLKSCSNLPILSHIVFVFYLYSEIVVSTRTSKMQS